MPDAANLAKAELRQIDTKTPDPNEIEPNTWCKVQFNPESLKVSFNNQLVKPPGSGDQRGSAAYQYVGQSTTKLSLTLWFDVGSAQGTGPPVHDVRLLTQQVAFFIRPKDPTGGKAAKGKSKVRVPPMVRFLWGSFRFDGVMDSLEETLEFFSPEGRPLRASLAVSLSQQEFQFAFQDIDKARASSTAAGAAAPGTAPLERTAAGSTVQGVADAAGAGGNWQSIAAANGIENPRLLVPGTLLDLNLQAPTLGARFGVADALQVAAPQLSLNAPQAVIGGALVN